MLTIVLLDHEFGTESHMPIFMTIAWVVIIAFCMRQTKKKFYVLDVEE